jgi:hypothetical protein
MTGAVMTPGPVQSGGFTLVELVVAMLLLQVGLLASAGLVVLASRTLTAAAELERAVSVTEAAADSLLRAPWLGGGQRREPPFLVRWTEAGDGLRVEAVAEGVDTVVVSAFSPWRPEPPT